MSPRDTHSQTSPRRKVRIGHSPLETPRAPAWWRVFPASILLLSAFSFVPASGGGDWPHLRGAGYDAKAGDISVSPALPNSPVVWKRHLGEGYSGCVVAGGLLFTQFQNRSGQYLLCLNAADGREVWRCRVDWPWEEGGLYAGPYSTPTWADGEIYFTTCGGEVGCVDASTGKIEWSFSIRERFGVDPPPFGYACSPLVRWGKVFVTLGEDGKSLAALAPDSGKTLWFSDVGEASYSSPLPMEVDGVDTVVVLMKNSIAAFDAGTGRVFWREIVSDAYDEQSSWPLVSGNVVFCASPFRNGSRVFRVSAGNGGAASAELAWRSDAVSSDVVSGVEVDGGIYVFDVTEAQADPNGRTKGFFKRIELSTGRETWRTDAVGCANVLSAGGRLLMFSETGTLIVAEPSPDSYRELWRIAVFPGAKRSWAAPALWGDSIFLRGGDGCLARVCLSGNPPENASTVFLQVPRRRFDISEWLSRFSSRDFVSPSGGTLFLWFSASFATLIFCRFAAFPRIFGKTRVPFLPLTIVASIAGTFLFSAASGRFVFALPAALFAAYAALSDSRRVVHSRGFRRFLSGRLPLLLLILACAAYFAACRHFFIPAGFAFPFGLIPAVALDVATGRFSRGKGAGDALEEGKHRFSLRLLRDASLFSLFFWSAAALVLWRT